MTDFFVFDTFTGRRIHRLPVLDGGWTETVNAEGDVWAKVSLRNSLVKRLRLQESGMPGGTSLAAVADPIVPQAGPIWSHELDLDKGTLTLRAKGGWSIADHRALLPPLAGRLPSDKSTDTRFMPYADLSSDYPWPTDTRTSRQGMIVQILQQMMSWPHGNVPFVLPAVIPGEAQDAFRGVDTAPVGSRIRDITQLVNGVDVHCQSRRTTAGDGFEWVWRIGTPTQPLLYSAQRPVFNVGVKASSVTNLRVTVNGSKMASQAFSSGGKAVDQALVAVATNSTLTDAGLPLFDVVDQQRSTVSEEQTLQDYADELLARGQKPVQTWSFTHDLSMQPSLSSFNVGDFAKVRVRNNLYFADGEYIMRILSRSGDARGRKVDLTFQPSGEFTPGWGCLMPGGYEVVEPDELLKLLRQLRKDLDEVGRASGTQTAESLKRIQEILDGILGATNLSVPGFVSAGGAVNAGGNVNAGGTLVSPYARTHSVVTSYVAAYIDGSGNFLATPSTRRMKRDVVTASWTKEQRSRLRFVYYRLRSAYILADMLGDAESAETLVGVIGEELIEAGFPEFVVLDDKGRVFTVRYELLAVIALDGLQQADERIDALEARMEAAGL